MSLFVENISVNSEIIVEIMGEKLITNNECAKDIMGAVKIYAQIYLQAPAE